MSERRKVLLPCPCGECHEIVDPGATTYLRCKKSGAIITYECESIKGYLLRGINREYPIIGENVVAGRKAPMEINHPVLSRHHCCFLWDESLGEYTLADLGSRNGTWLNGRKLTEGDDPLPLRGGDLIRMVDVNFRYLSPNGNGEEPNPLIFDDLDGTGLEFPDIKPEDQDNDKLIGRLLGEYRIISVISQGGMGRVYRAEKEATGQACVVKTILPNERGSTASNEILQRFLLEMELSLHLSHPNIVNYYDIGQVGKSLYIVMEYFPGRDLKDWFEHTPATYEQVINIGRQVAEGLAYAHNNGVVHRDIKPENILYNVKGDVKIIDFGVAKGSESKNTSGITVTGAFVGTLKYMAPEQLMKESDVTQLADIYSLGATLYYCLAGRSPFSKTGVLSKLRKEMKRGVPPLSEFCRGVPESLSQVIEKALSVDSADRFQSAEEMAQALANVVL